MTITGEATVVERTEIAVVAEKAPREKLKNFLNEGDARIPTPTVPEGFNSSKHLPLKKSDFINESTFCLFKAAECERKAINYREQAVKLQTLGGASPSGKAKKLLDMQSKMATLVRELAGDTTVDLRAILGEDKYNLLMGITAPAAE